MASERNPVPQLAIVEGFNIKKSRENAGVTQADLAGAAGLSISQISRFESGERMPRVDELERIAARLRVPITFLIYGDRPPPHAENGAGVSEEAFLTAVEAVLLALPLSATEEESRAWASAALRLARTPPDPAIALPPRDQLRLVARGAIPPRERK